MREDDAGGWSNHPLHQRVHLVLELRSEAERPEPEPESLDRLAGLLSLACLSCRAGRSKVRYGKRMRSVTGRCGTLCKSLYIRHSDFASS